MPKKLPAKSPVPPEDHDAIETPDTSAADLTALNAEVSKDLEARIKANDRQKKDLHAEWRSNVEFRMGRLGGRAALTSSLEINDDFQSDINPDWFLTKTKIANLYSQVPQVQVTHESTQYAPAIPPFAKQLNYELSEKRANVGVAMREVLADIVNAAGIGFVLVDYVARFEDKQVPSVDVSMIDPALVEQAVAMHLIPTTTVSQVVSDKFAITRVAPMDGIWPADFAGSNFDDSDFLGYRGRASAADVQHMFTLTDAQIAQAKTVLAASKNEDSLKVDDGVKADLLSTQKLSYDRVFYWRHRYDPAETSLTAIWEIVFVKGITASVRHQLWSGQRQDPKTGKYVGACRFPVRVGTITYISDNPIVPSDTSAGRPQVTDLRRSRSQMFLNRKRSTPLRWGNVNLLGPEAQAQINDGTYQGFIWTNGTGERAIGEIARASYPSEDLAFDQSAMADLLQSWGLTPSSMGLSTPGRKNQMEVGAEVSGFSTNIGADRSLIQLFFLGIVEVLASLMALYSEFQILTPQEKQTMEQAWNRQSILTDMVLKIRPDSMIVLDPQQRIQRISGFMNLAVKSGYVAPKSLLTELAELSGIDPTEVIIDPTPPQPERPQLSYRFTGKEDMQNIAVVAMLAKNGALPSPDDVATAKKFLLEAQNPTPTPAESAPPSAAGSAGGGVPSAPPPPGAGGAPPIPPHPADAEAHTDWSLASKIAARSRDMTPGGE